MQNITTKAILIDGKKMAEEIIKDLKKQILLLANKPSLAIIVVGENKVTEKFIIQKQKIAKILDVSIKIYRYSENITNKKLLESLNKIINDAENDGNHLKNSGIIIQLPLPKHLDANLILNSLPLETDIDLLSAKTIGNFIVNKNSIDPPIVGAIKIIFEKYKIDYKNKYIVLVGAGDLVGKPLAMWLLKEKVSFSILDKNTINLNSFLSKADIIISGVGKAKLITGDLIKTGAILIDAGTSEVGQKITGDVDFNSCIQKASLITPTPGGVGPLTVAMLFKNLIDLIKSNQ